MKAPSTVLVALALAGCNEGASSSGSKAPPEPSGRWSIAPATSSTESTYFAWRIDTETGGLEMCEYNLSWYTKDPSGNVHLGSPKCSDLATWPSNDPLGIRK
jgi:hypothetical protein